MTASLEKVRGMTMTIFSIRTKALCKKNKITLAFLESELGLKKSTSSNWNKKNPNADTVLKISNYFNVSTDYLLGKSVEIFNNNIGLSQEILYILNACENNEELTHVLCQLIKIKLSS